MITGSCLCNDVAFEVEEPVQLMSHCHCSRCRKAHGAPFATYVMAPADAFRLRRGADRIGRFEGGTFARPFCRRCGSVVSDGEPFDGMVGVPVGLFDDDPGARPAAHIFVGSKAPWYEIRDALPQFEAFPPGVDVPVLADRPVPEATGGIRGSCLCGGVAYVIDGQLLQAWNCHCGRCRKARAAAHTSNLFTPIDAVRFLRGEDLVASWKVPEAERFRHVFCGRCGSPVPSLNRERGVAVVPMGGLDDDPGIRPERHIFVGSKAPWFEIADDLPQHAEYPT